MRFACPACSAVINCPDEFAGKQVSCPKCGLKVIIPAPVPPPDAASEAFPGPFESSDANADFTTTIPQTSRSPNPTPAAKMLPRSVWIGAIVVGLLACLACVGIGISMGIRSMATTGMPPPKSPGIVGISEPAQAHEPGTFVEFDKDGTGTTAIPNPMLAASLLLLTKEQKAKLGDKERILRGEFRWEIGPDRVLVIDGTATADPASAPAHVMAGTWVVFRERAHYRFKRDGDTLTLTSIGPWPDFVLRKVGAN